MSHQLVLAPTIRILACVYFLGAVVQAGVPMARSDSLVMQQSQELGLYNSSDKVVILTNSNFNSTVLQQKHTSLVEFYNSYCGHCKRFAPAYKQLANELFSWRDVLKVCAIDCAAEENNEICREYEVMAYPTLRYFGLDYQPSAENYGKRIETQNLGVIRATLADWIASENHTSEMPNWPNFQSLNEKESESLFAHLESSKKYVVLVYEEENSTVGIETILNFQRYPEINVRRVNDLDVARKFKIDGSSNSISFVDRQQYISPHSPSEHTSKAYRKIIEIALKALQVTEAPNSEESTLPSVSQNETVMVDKDAIIKTVHSHKHMVYQADLEMAVRSTLFNEIPKISVIDGERLLALQRYIAVLKRYNPLGANGQAFVSNLYEFVMQRNQNLRGQDFEDEVKRLEQQYQPIFSANHFVGCIASRQGLRGFTCSLWQLFHHFTVQAATSETSQDPLEVLQAVHGYVKYFFGCSDCSNHFQEMAARRKIWNTPNKDDAILWLWAAHNEVNLRLAGDPTEDPEFPKIQFPSKSSCPQCHKEPSPTSEGQDISWEKDSVLRFLKNIHNPEYVNRFGVQNENLLRPTLLKLRQKRMVGNVFSDMDMRMGMMLYGFCIIMMVAAFKLFAFKGYRKKPYGQDLCGKA